jgi:ABC-type oligopeptide transport system substrate-binding subunit
MDMTMKKTKKCSLVLLLLPLNIPPAFSQTPDIKEGLWEVSSQVSMAAMPMKIPAMTMQQCFTKQSMSPENILQQNNCQMHDLDIQNNQVRWSMNCEQEGMKMQGLGKIQYQKTSFSGTFDMTMSGAPQGAMAIQTKITGRYLGKCQ